MPNVQKNLGLRLREARVKADLSQQALGELSELSTSQIGQIERGERNTSMPALARIAKALNVSANYLLADQELRESKSTFAASPKWKQLTKLSENADDELLDICIRLLRYFRKRKASH